MKKAARFILEHLPKRRRRHWRYVSPQRRGAGAVILAILALAVAGYWYLPRVANDWTRRRAAAYLRESTGGRVEVASARFSLFGRIELRGVDIDVPDSSSQQRFFQADTVILRHRPWSLLSEARLEPTEIVCIEPKVALEYDTEKGGYTAQELLAAARRGRQGGGSRGELPTISIRNVDLRLPTGRMRLSISMVPAGAGAYRIAFEEEREGARAAIYGTVTLDLATGKTQLHGEIPIPNIERALPERYARWRRWYDIRGKVILKGRPDPNSGRTILEAELADVSLKLKPAEGGLGLAGVHGTLVFDKDGVAVRDLIGRVPQAGGATFRMSGRYGGYDPNSPFDLDVAVEDMAVPDGSGATGWLADALKGLNEAFRPTGKLDISADFERLRDGRIVLGGQARPKGMSTVYRWFPYRLDDVTGLIRFSSERITLAGIRGRHGKTELAITGEVDLRAAGRFDVTVSSGSVRLESDLRRALPEGTRRVWDEFSPSGTAGGTVHVWRGGKDKRQQVEVNIQMDGRASMAYRGFPYRLDGLTGEIRIAQRRITVDSLRSQRGGMECTINGVIDSLGGSEGQTNLTIEASGLPLDAKLIAALPKAMRRAVESLHPTGRVDLLEPATVRHRAGQPADYRIVARVGGAAFRADAFPYAVTDANGVLTIRPGSLAVEKITGRHGASPVTVSGQVLLGGKLPALDLRIDAKDVKLDGELLAALPQRVKGIWRRISPSGLADIDLSLRRGTDGDGGEWDYRLGLRARGMQIRYEEFPYVLRGVTGQAIATPGRVQLKGMTAARGKMRLVLDGELTADANAEGAQLKVRGTHLPIDGEFLGAVPPALAPLARRFRPGGTCDLDLKDLRIWRRVASGRSAATLPATRPAGREPLAWAMRGRVAFHEATIDLGLGHKTLSGSLSGDVSQTPAGLALNADLALDSVLVARQRLTKFRGRLTKKPAGRFVQITDLSAKAHGGQVAGFARVRLADPLEYGISLSVRAIKLEDLFNAGVTDPAKRSNVTGLLDGNIRLSATAGKKPTRRASGQLRISRAKLYKVPVMLGLLHVVYLALPGGSAFTEGNVTYNLRDETLTFNEIHLVGGALSIVGSGTMDMKTKVLKLTFLAGPPRKLPRMGSLDELLVGIARELAEIRVTGTLAEPRMRTVPLRSLDRVIRDLLNPGRGK